MAHLVSANCHMLHVEFQDLKRKKMSKLSG